MKIETSKGYTEVMLVNNCDFDQFYKVAEILRSTPQIEFTNKLIDFDSMFWDFTYKNIQLTLHYNIYLGISIFPKNFTNATRMENELVVKLSEILNQSIEKFGSKEQ